MSIPLFSTYIDPEAHIKIKEVLDSTFVSEGRLVKEFEERLAKEFGWKNPVTVNSGTSALHLALLINNIGPGDEVICPPQTFIATALAVMQVGAKPVFSDIQYETGNMDPAKIQQVITSRTKAILPVHWGGYPCDMDEIHVVARNNNLLVIEDAAHALGAFYKGKPVGAISAFTCFSFQAIKHLTTGDGGALCCAEEAFEKEARIKRWFGIDRDAAKQNAPVTGGRLWDIATLGYKYHLNDYSAALGLANLKGIKQRIARRRAIGKRYNEAFKQMKGITLFSSKEDREGSQWLYGMHVEQRENFALAMRDRGVTVSVVDRRIDSNSIFGGLRKELEGQARFEETQIHIPINDHLTEENIEHIISAVKAGW